MLGETGNMSRDKVLVYIEHANDLEIQEIMDAVERRFALAYPQWDVLYTAVHKDPELRRKDLQEYYKGCCKPKRCLILTSG